MVIILEKRVVVSFFCFCLIVALLVYRIADINLTLTETADVQSGVKSLFVAQSRGLIYDCNMNPLVGTQKKQVLFVNPSESAMAYLENELNASDYQKAQQAAADKKPFLLECDGYDGEHNDVISLDVYERYSENDLAVHITGYLDSNGNGVGGIEKAFNSILNDFSGSLRVSYTSDAQGVALGGMGYTVINEDYASPGGIVLTLDSEIQRVCEQALENSSIEKGAVVVLDVKTGEIAAAACKPSFDKTNLALSLTDSGSPFVSRYLNSYSVGSVFKPVVAAAALQQGISADTFYECSGSVVVNGIKFNCHKKTGHGMLNMSQAMAVSCNCYFIKLGQDVGADAILTLASQLGLGKKIDLCDSLSSSSGNLPEVSEIDSLPALANLSFGQGTLLATPLQIAALYSTFANGGYYVKPYLLKSMVDENEEIYAEYINDQPVRILTSDVCKGVNSMLAETVKNGSGILAAPANSQAAGKTATAETGQYENGTQIVHTWFAGYFPVEAPKYTVVVFREDGETSSTDCAPVFREIANGIKW